MPILGTRKISRLEESAGAANIKLSADEISMIDRQLESISMSRVFGQKTTYKL
ncbi:MAG: hypothetical protein HDR88_18290 [Bacteroides sp.]|nr:hypothetical protein [Bacteroides sp.]